MDNQPESAEALESTELTLTVAEPDVGTRLDRFVAAQLPDMSRSFIQQLIAEGHIRRNGKESRAAEPLRAADQITVRRPLPRPSDLTPQDIPLTVVYEDADVVVVDKVSGMVVHPAPGHPDGTLVNALLWRYPQLRIGDDLRPGIVHRLDRDTSGLIVVARHEAALRNLQAQQLAHTMTKRYLAVVEGVMKELSGVIDAPIGRSNYDRLRMAVVADGRPARTHWQVLEALDGYTLLDIQLETGRTHQIRVHLAHKNRPVLADPLYGLKKPRSSFGLTRQFLHAQLLGFALPSSGERVEFSAPLAADLALALAKLRVRAGGNSAAEPPAAEDLLP